jgi:hypothetical protein
VETIQRTYTVPIVYRNASPDHQPAEPRPTSAEVTLVGSERVFDMFDPSTMLLSLDLSRAEGGSLEITARNLNRPSGLTVTQIVPDSVPLVSTP